MSCPINQDALDQLKKFIVVCKVNPSILHLPALSFFKEYIMSLGGTIPKGENMPFPEAAPTGTEEKSNEPEAESDAESDLDIDNEGCVEPDELDEGQKMGDTTVLEVPEENCDKADELRSQAMRAFSEGDYTKSIELYTQAIEVNPLSALLFTKRGLSYLKLNKPNAAIKDCSRALELNCDSAAAYKFRGRAYRLLGKWEEAAKDLRQACNIDFDEQSDEWLKEVTPNAKKIEQHNLKRERKRYEKEEREKLERVRRAREAHAKAAKEAPPSFTDDGEAPGMGGAPGGMGDFYKLLMQDPEIVSALMDPEVSAAFEDITKNPENISKYTGKPKIMALLSKFSSKLGGMGGMGGMGGFPGFGGAGRGAPGGMGGFPGGFPGAPESQGPPPNKPFDDDNLD